MKIKPSSRYLTIDIDGPSLVSRSCKVNSGSYKRPAAGAYQAWPMSVRHRQQLQYLLLFIHSVQLILT